MAKGEGVFDAVCKRMSNRAALAARLHVLAASLGARAVRHGMRLLAACLLCCALYAGVSSAGAETGEQPRSLWALPGAEITAVNGTDPKSVSMTVKFAPASSPDLFRLYVNAENKTLEALRNKSFDVKLEYGKPQTPSPELGITFSMAREGRKVCVYATGPTVAGVPVWRVRRSVQTEDLAESTSFCRAFKGAPASCAEVEGCTQSRCLPGQNCGPDNCCVPGTLRTSAAEDNCVDLSKLVPEKLTEKSDVKAGRRTLIPESCYDNLVPPPSQLSKAYPNYRPVVGAVAYCLTETFRNIFHPNDYQGSFFQRLQTAMKAGVTGTLALAVVLFGYKLMYSGKSVPGRAQVATLMLQMVAVVYFTLGDGAFFIFDAAWKTSAELAGAALRITQGVSQGSASTTGAQEDAPADPKEAEEATKALDQKKEQLDKNAQTYADLLHQARNAYAFHQKISEDFDIKLKEVEVSCSDYSVNSNTSFLLSPSGPYSAYLPPDWFQKLQPALKLKDFYHCGVERSCALLSHKGDFGEELAWKTQDPGLGELYPDDVQTGPLSWSTCEHDVLTKNIPLEAKDSEAYKNAEGGEVGRRFKDMKRKVADLFLKYEDYYSAMRMIANHNILVYYYKTASLKDKEIEIVKDNIFIINNQIQTLQKKLAELDGQIKDISNKFDQSCIKDNTQAEALNTDNQRLTKRITDINIEENDLNKQLEDIKNLNITEAEKTERETSINAKLESINNERKEARKTVNDNLEKLKDMGCVRQNNTENPLDEITKDREELEDLLDKEKQAKNKNNNEDKRIQLDFKKIALRLEKRLALTRSEFPQYYRELYCALSTINLGPDGVAVNKDQGFKNCTENVNNPRPICLDKHLMIFYDILIDQRDPFYENVMEIRNQCDAVAQKGTAIGEGFETDKIPTENERGKVLKDFYEALPMALQKFYTAAKSVCWLGGTAPNVAELLQTLPKEDLETGEQTGISQNDKGAYGATDAPSPGNPYVSYLHKQQIDYTISNREKNSPGKAAAIKAQYTPVAFSEDCKDGEADLAIQAYCEALFGGNIGDEGKGLSFAGEKMAGLDDFGLHGCAFYLRLTKDKKKPGMLDKLRALDQLCPARTEENKPITQRHGWNFSEPLLCQGIGLDGTQRDYYTCKAADGKTAAPPPPPAPTENKELGKDANIPTSYDDLVRIFGAKDNPKAGATACLDNDSASNKTCYAEDFINCGLQGGAFEACSKSLPGGQEGKSSVIGKAMNDMMRTEFEYEMQKAQMEGKLPGGTPGGGGSAAKPEVQRGGLALGAMAEGDANPAGQELTGKLYPYCNRIATSGTDQMFLLWDTLDCKLQRYLGVGAPHIQGFSKRSPKLLPLVFAGLSPLWPIIALMGIVVVYYIVFVVFRTAQMYFIAFAVTGLLMLVSPIFIPMCLFSATKKIYDNWLKNLLGNFLQPFVVSTLMIFLFYILDLAYFGGNHQFDAANNIIKACGGEYCDQYTLGYAVDESKFKKLWFIPYVIGIDKGGVKLVVGLAKMMGALYVCSLLLQELTAMSAAIVSVYNSDAGGAMGRAASPVPDFAKTFAKAGSATASFSGRATRLMYVGSRSIASGARSASNRLKTGRVGIPGEKK